MYEAKNVDTQKALEYIELARKNQENIVNIEIREKKAYLDGIMRGLNIAESIFHSHFYEKKETTEESNKND